MNTQIIKKKTPEEQELDKKKTELAALEAYLAERELELATLDAELHSFQMRYLKIVGLRLAELDQIEAEIAEALAVSASQDSAARQQAEQAQARAKESAKETDAARREEPSKFQADEDLKKLYYKAAKKFHPDLAIDDEERARRTKIMADVNKAYADGDQESLRAILEETEAAPEYVKGESIGAELVRVIRKIAQVRQRLEAIMQRIVELKASDLFKLMMKIEEAEKDGIDLLGEMVSRVDRDISDAREHLAQVKKNKKDRQETASSPQQSFFV